MTDRHSTIPPPPDRVRTTGRPDPADAPQPAMLTLSENVLLRLIAIENWQTATSARLNKLDELHGLFMGAAPTHPGGKPRPSIVSELHQMNTNMSVIGVNTDFVAEQQKSLPELIAEQVANKVVALYQTEIRALREADEALLSRIEKLIESSGAPLPNGNGDHK
jgi:hypothetical protein